MKYFKVDKSAIYQDNYVIRFNFDDFPPIRTRGSYGVLPARLLHISYANYLRLCRDSYGAKLYGKGSKYSTAVFKDKGKATELSKVLNERLNIIL